MKMLIQIALVALVVGGVSAGGSIYWHRLNAKPVPTEVAANAEKDAKPADVKGDTTEKTDGETHGDVASSTEPDTATSPSSEPKSEKPAPVNDIPSFGPPVAARPPYEPTGDEAGDLINKLRVRLASTSRQERKVAEREEAMKLIIDDLRNEQANSAKLRKRILDEQSQSVRAIEEARRVTEAERATIQEDMNETRRKADEQIQALLREKEESTKAADDALKAAREQQEDLEKQLDAFRKPAVAQDKSGSPEETANLKKMVPILDSMPPETTAKNLQELVEKGRTEAVVAILNSMKPRVSAKVITAISEAQPALAADLIERLKRLKKDGPPPAAAAK